MSTGLEVTDYDNTTTTDITSTMSTSTLPNTTTTDITTPISTMSTSTLPNATITTDTLLYQSLDVVQILDNWLDNVTSVGLMSLPDDTSSFFSSNFTIISDSEITFDVNNLIGINGFSFANYNGIEFAVVLKDRMGYLSYATPNALYLINTNT